MSILSYKTFLPIFHSGKCIDVNITISKSFSYYIFHIVSILYLSYYILPIANTTQVQILSNYPYNYIITDLLTKKVKLVQIL